MRQKLGQHFLKNKKYLARIASALEPEDGDTIVEIGPGHGELTDAIVARLQNRNASTRVIVIEKDKGLAQALREKFSRDARVEIAEGDALKVLPALVECRAPKNRSYKLAGNIPYYITGHLFRVVGEMERKPSRIVLTIQKEVAERICAQPPRMNLLASSVQIWADPKIVAVIPKRYFSPPPKVESAVLLLQTQTKIPPERLSAYFAFAKMLFKQPRKTVTNNLRGVLQDPRAALEALGLPADARPQALSVRQIAEMASHLAAETAKK